MAREIRKAARDCGEDVAAHHGLVKMIPQWERGGRAPRERYRLLYLKIFQGAAWASCRGAWDSAWTSRCRSLRSAPARPGCPAPGRSGRSKPSALAKPRSTMTAAEIRALTAETISRLHEVADNLAKLSALLSDDEADEADEGSEGKS